MKHYQYRWIKTKYRTILIRIKVTINQFHLLWTFDREKSADFLSHSLKIWTWRWHFTNANYFTRPGYSNQLILFLLHKRNWFLPFNFDVKSATMDFVLLNSVLDVLKFDVVVSKLFEIATIHSIILFLKNKKIYFHLKTNYGTSQFFSQGVFGYFNFVT